MTSLICTILGVFCFSAGFSHDTTSPWWWIAMGSTPLLIAEVMRGTSWRA